MLVVGGVVLAVLGVMADRPHSHVRVQLAWLFPAVIVLTALELMQAELWGRLLRALSGQLDVANGLAVWCVSALARYVPTSMLMPVVRVRMSRARGVPGDVCIASLFYEALLVNCGAACVGAYFVITLPALRGDISRWGVLLLPLAAISALHPRVFAAISGAVLRRMGRAPLAAHLSVGQLLRFTAGYVASFVLAGVGLIVVVLMVHSVTWQGAPTIVGAMAIGFVASAFAFVLPGGLGAREAALVAALSPAMPTFVATTAAVALRLIQLAIEVILALLLPWMARRHDGRQIVKSG
jgi:glycosyltransferase 2 family protein